MKSLTRGQKIFFVIVIIVIIGAFNRSLQTNYGVDSLSTQYLKTIDNYKNDQFKKTNFDKNFKAFGGTLPATIEINSSGGEGKKVARVGFVNDKNETTNVVYSQYEALGHLQALISANNRVHDNELSDNISISNKFTVKGHSEINYTYTGFKQGPLKIIQVCQTRKGDEKCALLDEFGILQYYNHLKKFNVTH